MRILSAWKWYLPEQISRETITFMWTIWALKHAMTTMAAIAMTFGRPVLISMNIAHFQLRESHPFVQSKERAVKGTEIQYHYWPLTYNHLSCRPGAAARSEASSLGMQAAPSSIPTSGTFFRGDLVMKPFLRPFSLFRWFKKSSCQLLAKECALSTGKLPRRLAQEQCG